MNRTGFTSQLRHPWSRYGVTRSQGVRTARLRLNITIDYELRARSSAPIRGRNLFYWRKTRVRMAKIVSQLSAVILPLPSQFFEHYCSAQSLAKARRQWNASAAEHLSRSR